MTVTLVLSGEYLMLLKLTPVTLVFLTGSVSQITSNVLDS